MGEDTSVKQQVQALLVLVQEQREQIVKRRDAAMRQAQSSSDEIGVIDQLVKALDSASSFYARGPILDAILVGSLKATKVASGHNRRAIVEILKEKGEPMRVVEIARVAHERGLIRSRRGLDGVYATISTVLARNNKHLFISLGNGKWEFRERRNAGVVSAPARSPWPADSPAPPQQPHAGPPIPTGIPTGPPIPTAGVLRHVRRFGIKAS
jgi:hypothetical protein